MLKKIVVSVLVFAIFTAGGLAAYQVSQQSQNAAAQQDKVQTGENLVLETGIWQFTQQSQADFTAGFNDTGVTVRNSSGDELTRGTDYEWNSTDGSVYIYNTSSVSDGASGEIDYEYQENTQPVQTVGGPLSSITEGIGLLPIAAGGLGLVVLIIGFATGVGKFFGASGPGSGR